MSLAALRTRVREEETLEWIGGEFDPEAFDLEGVNATLRRLGRGR